MKSIRTRLMAGLGLIILFLLIQAGLVWWVETSAKRDLMNTVQKNTLAAAQLSELAVLGQQVRRYEKEYFVYVGNKERRAAYEKEWSDASVKINKVLTNMQTESKSTYSDEDLLKINAWMSAADFYASEMRKIFTKTESNSASVETYKQSGLSSISNILKNQTNTKALAAATDENAPVAISPVEANAMITEGKTKFSDVLIKGVTELSANKTKQTLALTQVTGKTFDSQLIVMLSTILLGLIIAAVLMFTLPHSITEPLKQLSDAVDHISKGNLDKKMVNSSFVEFDGLTKAIERMQIAQKILIARMRA
jgi:HAMP domain-containing protein